MRQCTCPMQCLSFRTAEKPWPLNEGVWHTSQKHLACSAGKASVISFSHIRGAYHVDKGAGGEGFNAKGAAGREDSHGHQRFQHLDEGDAEVEVGSIAQPQRACKTSVSCHVNILGFPVSGMHTPPA